MLMSLRFWFFLPLSGFPGFQIMMFNIDNQRIPLILAVIIRKAKSRWPNPNDAFGHTLGDTTPRLQGKR